MLYADERFQNDKELVYGKSNEFTGSQYFFSPDKAWKSVKPKKNGIKQIKRRNARVCVVTQNNKLLIVNILR